MGVCRGVTRRRMTPGAPGDGLLDTRAYRVSEAASIVPVTHASTVRATR